MAAEQGRFKAEAKAAAEKWGKEINIERSPKGTPTAPFPLVFQRTIPQPESAAQWDVDHLIVRLKIANKDASTLQVAVGVGNKELPPMLRRAISEKLETQWKADLAAGGGAWFLEDILGWAEAKFNDLLCLCPELIERYDTGYSELRYLIRQAAEGEEEEEEDEEAAEEAAAAAAAEWERREYEKLIKAAEKKDAEAAEKRKAAEDGLDSELEGGRKLSKKQMDAIHAAKKAGKSQRWAKAPPKSSKFGGEGSAEEKAKSTKQKKADEDPLVASRQLGNQRK